jgi:tripeptidyl-peptidase-1
VLHQSFFRTYRTDAVGSDFSQVLINGGQNDQSDPGVEVIGCRSMRLTPCKLTFTLPSGQPRHSVYRGSLLPDPQCLLEVRLRGCLVFLALLFIVVTPCSTGGSPPFKPDSQTPTNTNEPYLDWLNFVLSQSKIPQVITTSYGDDEQTVSRDEPYTRPSPDTKFRTHRFLKIMPPQFATSLRSLGRSARLSSSPAVISGMSSHNIVH